MTDRPRLRDFGDEPAPALRDLLRAIALDAPLTPGAIDLLAKATARTADAGILRLLPALRGKRCTEELSETIRTDMEIRYRRTAARYMLFQHVARQISRVLQDERITPLFLKGFPLATTFYASPACRPMSDLDIAVAPADYPAAEALLLKLGFVPRGEEAQGRAIPGVNIHAMAFHQPDLRVSVDLHHHVFAASLWNGADHGLWAAAHPFEALGAGAALTLAPEHHVLHACVHGYGRSIHQLSVRWMLDADLILKRQGRDFRWALLEAEAERHRCGPLVAAALGYLADHLASPVPTATLARLAALPMAGFDRAYFRQSARLSHSSNRSLRLRLAWNACQRQAGKAFHTPLPFITLLARRWGAGSPNAFARAIIRRWREPTFLRERRARGIRQERP
ncbi:MAG: nucleotidyltransferase family protein [Pseudomonadota bacterium]|uniref:Nucleotidyltransferase family protein n=1 Tax=hydrothermal vent metagenome TaxID=652676 RepID=A0A170PNW0_9ZZZZ